MNAPNQNAVDVNALRDLVGDDADEIKSIYLEFLQELKQVFVEIIKMTKRKDFSGVKDQAHYLKTSAYGVGTHKLAKLLGAVESAALNEDMATILFCVGQIKDEAVKIQAEITEILKNPPA